MRHGIVAETVGLQHPPAVSASRSDAETGTEVLEECRRQTLCKDVRKLSGAGNLENAKLTDRHLLPNEVDVDFDVFRAPVMDWIARHVHAGDVVAVGYGSLGSVAVELP